jgi:serine/threonine-protein phosphatase 2A regulatory subunit B
VEFDHTGNYLATVDKVGRVVLFERNETVSVIYQEVDGGVVY